MCNQTTLYCFSTYWFKPSYPFRPLIHSALIGSDVAKQPLRLHSLNVKTELVDLACVLNKIQPSKNDFQIFF
ncbi:hypothetical protein Hanom_Chr01g00009561 [Helianthus anomalus]